MIRGLLRMEGPAVKSQFPQLDDRRSHLIIALAIGALVLGLVVLVALLVANTDRDSTSRRCPEQVVCTVAPVTCLPYVGSGGAATGTNDSRSSARKPAQQPRQKAPAVKVPAVPKAPAAPPRISLRK